MTPEDTPIPPVKSVIFEEMNPKHKIGKPCKNCGSTIRYNPHGACVACVIRRTKATRKAHPERRAAEGRAYFLRYPEKVREKGRRADAKRKESRRAWIKEHPEGSRARSRKYRIAHPERVRGVLSAWKIANPDKVRENNAQRRARRKGAKVAGCRREYAAFLGWVRTEPVIPCAYCQCETLPGERHKDHYIPLIKGGADSVDNLRVACRMCNQRKHALMPDEFLKRIA